MQNPDKPVTLEQHWNSDHMRSVRRRMMAGETLPEPAKIAITEHLTNVSIPSKYRQEFNNIIDFMNRGVPTDGDVLRMRIHDLDRKRSQNLAVTEHEFAKLINYNYETIGSKHG